MPKHILPTLVAAALTAGTLSLNVHAQQPTPIKISYQPAVYWALPFWVAQEKGWWEKAGLKAEFSTFPAGVPQMAAAASKSWDVGATGSVPAVLGHMRFKIETIGISNDESAGNALIVRGDKAEQYRQKPELMKGQTIALTTNSTGDFAVQSCLKKYGLSKSDVTMKNMGQAEVMSALSSNNVELAGLWAPNIYTVDEKTGAKVLCSGKDGGVMVPGAIVTRSDYAQENPENVARFLAVYLGTWKWLNENREEAIQLMKRFYDQGGVSISEASMNKEFDTRKTHNLDEQLQILDRSSGSSQVDSWFKDLAAFLTEAGTIRTAPEPKDYITDKYMKMVKEDKQLQAIVDNVSGQ
jgi:ABC-type nitrate/sulfonate/bicarbonate transport systems, periplasmic components